MARASHPLVRRDLGVPNTAPCLLARYTRRCTESISTNTSVSAPGSSRVCASPWAKARKDPNVDGARIPPNVAGIAPCRKRSIPSMPSAPTIIPATSEPIFTPGFAPTLAATCPWSAANSSKPTLSASRTAGTSPACDTRHQL
jgi:hypothetical protein